MAMQSVSCSGASDECRVRVPAALNQFMKLLGNRLLVTWIPTKKVGRIHMPSSEMDYHNTDSVKLFKVLAAGPGHYTKKGVFVPNEVHPGDNVIVDSRISGRPEECGHNRWIIKNPNVGVIAVVPLQKAETHA